MEYPKIIVPEGSNTPLPARGWGEVPIDRTYEVEPNSYPEHDPARGYYIFRGLSSARSSEFIGPHWTEDFLHAYAFSELGRGDLFVAHIHAAEIQSKCIPHHGPSIGDGMDDRAPGYFMMASNPANARVMNPKEIQSFLRKVPYEFTFEPASSRRIDWRRLSSDLLAGTF